MNHLYPKSEFRPLFNPHQFYFYQPKGCPLGFVLGMN
ncbi:hypothetical protein M2306_001981 [Myroides gitamensis]|jgi:hypothetical protein|uniref:Uncharacterized protein n=1 Tax=Myroides odoratus TaxID=256 RepID=A0A378RWY5_MYROD|nr:hypothetical protein Myrod_2733 [Myroides odoratus DSM 2801]EKB05889.1 hypothetical protein HMPREF9716_02598 [Myroides odoratus CIP 103059]MCS4240071.1 hypothetical protein [Myroides odoratus]MDH6601287.1 hypothetical protein [Myroides gitamensis]STZ26508.1 Uncharacterised protein [Myroides odoratus]